MNMKIYGDKYTSGEYRLAIARTGIRKGNGKMYHCPFHKDKTPSLSIDFDKGQYHCFSCKRGGSIPKLVLEATKKPMSVVIDRNDDDRRDMGLYLTEYNKPTRIILPDENPLAIQGTIEHYRASESAQAYIKSRFIPEEVALSMGVGFSERTLINDSTWFINRVTFPIYNASGVLINLEGRDITKKAKAKCLYPKDSLKPLYEWYKLDKNKPLFMVEGLIKLLVLRTDPYFKNSSTVFGSYISDYQISQLRQFTGDFIIIPDNDDAGGTLVKKMREEFKDRVRVMKIEAEFGDSFIKDVDDIPRLTNMSVEQYRLAGKIKELEI